MDGRETMRQTSRAINTNVDQLTVVLPGTAKATTPTPSAPPTTAIHRRFERNNLSNRIQINLAVLSDAQQQQQRYRELSSARICARSADRKNPTSFVIKVSAQIHWLGCLWLVPIALPSAPISPSSLLPGHLTVLSTASDLISILL